MLLENGAKYYDSSTDLKCRNPFTFVAVLVEAKGPCAAHVHRIQVGVDILPERGPWSLLHPTDAENEPSAAG